MDTTLDQVLNNINARMSQNNKDLLDMHAQEMQAKQDSLNHLDSLLNQAEEQKNTDPQWLQRLITSKLENLKQQNLDRNSLFMALKNDKDLDSYFSSDNAKLEVINQMIGFPNDYEDSPIGKKLSAEDDSDNNWLYRQAVRLERGFEGVVRNMSSGVNNVLGGLNITDGSYDYKTRKLNEHLSTLPLSDIQGIEQKRNIQRSLTEEILSIDNEIQDATGLALQQLLQRKASLLKQRELLTFTPEEQKLLDNGTYQDYLDTQLEIDSLNKEKAEWEGGTILSNFDKDIVNDTESYHQWMKEARARGLDREYEAAGLDPSFLNLSYAVDKSLQMATDADYARVIGEILPFALLELTTGGTATPALLGGGLRGALKAGSTFLASQARNMTSRQVASWGLLGSDAYSRYNEYISEQYAKDPQGTADKLRAAEGAIAGVVADFFGSKLATGVAGKAFDKIKGTMSKDLAKHFADMNEGILLGNELKGASKEFNNAVIQPGLMGNVNRLTNGAFADNLRKADIADLVEPIKRAERDVNKGVLGKVYNTITAPKRAVEGLNKLDKKLAEKGLAPVRDAGKAGVYLGMENAMSETARQYGTGTDINEMDWNQIAESAVSGIGSGALFHYPGVGFHAVGSLAKQASKMGSKERLIPLQDKALKDLENRYKNKEEGFNDATLDRTIDFTKNQKLGIEKEKSKAYQKILNKVGEEYFDVQKDPQDNSIITGITLKQEAFKDDKALAKAQKLIAKEQKGLTLLDNLAKQADTVISRVEALKKEGKKSDIESLDKTTKIKEDGEEIETPNITNEKTQETIQNIVKSDDEELKAQLTDKFKSMGYSDEETNNILNSYKGDTAVSFKSAYITDEEAKDVKEFLSTSNRFDDLINLEYFQGITKDNEELAKSFAKLAKDPKNEANIKEFKDILEKLKKGKNSLASKAKLWDSVLDKDTIRSKAKSDFTEINDKKGKVKDVLKASKKLGTEHEISTENEDVDTSKAISFVNEDSIREDYKKLYEGKYAEDSLLHIDISDYKSPVVSKGKNYDALPDSVKKAYDKFEEEKKKAGITGDKLPNLNTAFGVNPQYENLEKALEELKDAFRIRNLDVDELPGYKEYKKSQTSKAYINDESSSKDHKELKKAYRNLVNDFIKENQEKGISSIERSEFNKYLEKQGIRTKYEFDGKDLVDEVYNETFEKIKKVIEKNNQLVNVPVTTKEKDVDKELKKTADGLKVSDYYEKAKFTIGGTDYYYLKEKDPYGFIKNYNEFYAKFMSEEQGKFNTTEFSKQEFKNLFEKLKKNELAKKAFDKLGIKNLELKDSDSDEVTVRKLQAINIALMSVIAGRNTIANKKSWGKKSLLLTNRYTLDGVKQQKKDLEEYVTQLRNEERLGQDIQEVHMGWLKDYTTDDSLRNLVYNIFQELDGDINIFEDFSSKDEDQNSMVQLFKNHQRHIDVGQSTKYLDIIIRHIDNLIGKTKGKGNEALLQKASLNTYKQHISLIKNLINNPDFAINTTRALGGSYIGVNPESIKSNEISKNMHNLLNGERFWRFISNLNRAGIHSDSSQDTTDLIQTNYGLYLHRNEANSSLAIEALMSIGKANNRLVSTLERLLSGTNTLDTVLGQGETERLLQGTNTDSIINSIIDDEGYTNLAGVKALKQAIRENPNSSTQDRIDFVNNLPASQKAEIAQAVLFNRAWQIQQNFVNHTALPANSNSSTPAYTKVDSYDEYVKQSQANVNRVVEQAIPDTEPNYQARRNTLKYALLASMADNKLMSVATFSSISTGLRYSITERETLSIREGANQLGYKSTETIVDSITKENPTTSDVETAVTKSTLSVTKTNREESIEIVANNLHAIRYNKSLNKLSKDDVIDYDNINDTAIQAYRDALAKHTDTFYPNKNKRITSYQSREANTSVSKENYSFKDLQEFRRMLVDSGITNIADIQALASQLYGESLTQNQINALNTFNQSLGSTMLGGITDTDDINFVGQVIANYIDNHNVFNSTTSPNAPSNTNAITPPASQGMHTQVIRDLNREGYKIDLRPNRTTIFGNGLEGISEFAESSAGTTVNTATREVAEDIRNLTRDVMTKTLVAEDSLLAKLYGQKIFGQQFLSEGLITQVVATAYNSIASISGGEVTEEFLTTLVSMGCSPAMIRYYTTNRILDFNTLASQLGKQIIQQLGLKFNDFNIPRDQLAMELGGLALDALEQLKVIELQHISKHATTDKGEPVVRGLVSGGLADSIKGVKLLDKIDTVKEKIDALDYEDVNGNKYNFLDESLGSYRARDEQPMTAQSYQQNQERLRNDFDISTPSIDVGKGAVQIDRVHHIARVILDKSSNPVEPNNSSYNPETCNVVYLDEEQVLKNDGTYVEPNRLLELASKQARPKTLYADAVRVSLGIFEGLTQADIEGINDWDLDNTNDPNLAKKKAIRNYIEFEEPSTHGIGVERDTLRNKNKTLALKAWRNWQFLRNQVQNGNQQYYFKEVNSVNNRSLVRGLLANYREDKACRTYYDYGNTLPTISELATSFNESTDRITKDLTLFAKTSILANFGFDYDKSSEDTINATWNKLAPLLNKLFKGGLSYTDANGKPQQTGALDLNNLEEAQHIFELFNEEVKESGIKLDFNPEKVTTLYYMSQMKSITDWSNFTWNDNLRANWHIKFEVDGLTNGPAIKGWSGTAFYSRFNELSKQARLAAGVSSINDYGDTGVLGTFVDLKAMGHNDTYLLNGEYVTEQVADRIADQVVYNVQDANHVKDFLAQTYINSKDMKKVLKEKGNPPLSALTIKEIFKGILSRNMLKPPTMVTNYGAGYKALINKMLNTFTTQASSLFALYVTNPEDETHKQNLRNWLQQACKLNGGSIVLNFKNNLGETTKVYINAEGNLSYGVEGPSNLNIFDNSNLNVLSTIENCTLNLYINTNLATKITENFIDPMWDGMAEALEPFKRMDSIHGKIADATADMLNRVIMQECNAIMNTDKITAKQENLEQAIKRAVDRVSTVLSIGSSEEGNSTLLNQVRNSKNEILTTIFNTLLQHKDGNFFLKNQINIALKEGLASGLVPVSTHTTDSNIMHLTQASIRALVGETLGVHDAIVVTPTQVATGGRALNENYWKSGIRSYETFAKRNAQFKTNIDNFVSTFTLVNNGDMINHAYNLYDQAQAECQKLIDSRFLYLQDQIAKSEAKDKVNANTATEAEKELAKEKDTFNQYAFLNYTVFEPTTKQLKDELDRLSKFDPNNPVSCDNRDVGDFIYLLNKNAYALCSKNPKLATLFKKDNIASKYRLKLDHSVTKNNLEDVDSLVSHLKRNTGNDQATNDALDELVTQFNQRTTAIKDFDRATAEEHSCNLFNSVIANGTNYKARGLYNAYLGAEGVTVTEGNIIQDAYRRGIQKARSILLTEGLDNVTGLLALVGSSSGINANELSTFYRLFGSVVAKSDLDKLGESDTFTTLAEANKDTNARIHVNLPGDRLNINTINNYIERSVNLSQNEDTPLTLSDASEVWFKDNIEEQVKKKYGNFDSNDVVVFSMSSLEDVLELQAITKLWTNNDLNKFKIAIQPNITNVDPSVNKDLQYTKMIDEATNVNSVTTWFARTVPNTNKNLGALEYVLGRKLNEAYIEEGVSSTYVYNSLTIQGKKEPKRGATSTAKLALTKTNEYGVSYSYTEPKDAREYTFSDFTSLDLRESGIQDMGTNDVPVLNVSEEYKHREPLPSDTIYDVKTQLSDIKDNTIVFDIYGDGSFIDSKVNTLVETDNQLRALKQQYQVIRARRINEYNNGKIDRDAFLRPIFVTVPASYSTEGRTLSAVFRVTIDNYVTPSSLKDLISYKTASGGTTTSNPQEWNREHPLFNLFDPSKMHAVAKFVRENQHSSATEVRIPSSLMNPVYKDRSMQYSNKYDRYLDEFADSNSDNYKGITSYAFFTKYDPSASEEFGKGFNTINTLNCNYIPLVNVKTKNMNTVGKEANKSISGILREAASQIKQKIRGYSRGDVKIDSRKVKLYNDKFEIATKQDVKSAMEKALADDKSRGITTEHLEPLMGLIENLAMKIMFNEVENSKDAGEAVISHITEKAVFVQYGKNYTGSSLEVLMHEIMHGVFEHLALDTSAHRQATQLFRYAASNLKLEHFECPREEAERIMKYIFNDSTADNLQEFLAYAMTNNDFQVALNNMGIDKSIAKEFFSKTQSVTSRLFNTLFTNLDADEIPTSMSQAIGKIFNVTYANSQKVWEAQRQFDTLSQEEKESFIKHNGTVDRLVQEGLSHATSISGRLISVENFVGNAFGGNDNTLSLLTDQLRKLSDNHLGFVHELATSLEGVSPRNYEYIRLRQKAKVAIDMQREKASSAINNHVSELIEKLPSKVRHQLTKYLVQADVSCLFDGNTKLSEVDTLLKDPKARKKKIKEIEAELSNYAFGKYYINASKGLSEYCLNGINPTGLGYRNAYEITSFAGSKYWSHTQDSRATELVDKLTTLYSVDSLDTKDNNIYSKVPTNVLGALLELHNSVKEVEKNELLKDSEQRYHIPKGQLHGGKSVGSYKIYPMANKEAVKWSMPTSMTTTKLDPFFKGIVGDEKFITTHHAFRSSIPVDAGIYAMTDKFNGRVAKGLRVGNDEYSTNPEDLRKIHDYVSRRIDNLNTNKPSLINPKDVDGGIVLSFASNGNLIGANFELNPVETNKKIGRNIKFTNVIGDLYGSCVERISAPDVNANMAKSAIALYDNTKNKNDFFWIKEDSTNEKERDYFKRIPYEAKQIFKERFGDQGIPVPKSAATIVLGKESLSSKKIDTEYYKAVAECRDTVVDYMKHLFRHGSVGLAEDLASYLTKIGKNNIVIKGLSVSINNILSNTLTLTRHGLSPIEAIRDQMEGVQQVRELETLQEQLRPFIVKKLNNSLTTADINKMRALKQMISKLPIYPLYSEGVLGSIVEDLDDSDSFVKDTIDKYLSGNFAKMAHFMVNDEKSRVFKLFKDLADIGDKAGKYALYKHQPDSMPLKEKLRRSTETFIDYAIPLPTGFDMIERVGLQNFLKYPLGIQSELYNSLTQRPDDALKSLMIQASLGFKVPDAYGSLLGIGNFNRGLNFPGLGLFFDSLSCLPTAKIANEIFDTF